MKHGKVIDTAVLFPHRQGLPLKRSLKNLALDILKRIIQDSDSGHDSTEDADTCMALLRHKVKSDHQLTYSRFRYLKGSTF